MRMQGGSGMKMPTGGLPQMPGGSGIGGPRGSAAPRGMPGAPLPSGAGNQANTPPLPEGATKRTEFVILLIWKEPTPSDTLRGLTTPQDASNPTAGPKVAAPLPASSRPRRPKVEPSAESKEEPTQPKSK
jgi:hypothetical protein